MSRVKTFAKDFIMFILVYFLVDFMVNNMIQNSYVEMEDTSVAQDVGSSYTIEVKKATKNISGGELELKITKNENKPETKYLKVDFYNQANQIIGSRYIDPTSVEIGQSKDMDMKFSYKDYDHSRISTIAELPSNALNSNNGKYLGLAVLIGLITLCYVL